MTFPTDTLNFDPIPDESPINSATFNPPLSQISGAISALQNLLSGSNAIPVTYGASLAALNAVFLNPVDSKVYAIDADNASLSGFIRGFIDSTGAANATGLLTMSGFVNGFSGLTPFLPVYVDATGDGTITHTKPVPTLDGGQIAIVPMGIAITTTTILVLPAHLDARIHYARRYSPAVNETITLQHHANTDGFRREFLAYVTQDSVEYINPVKVDGWSSSNADMVAQAGDAGGASINTYSTFKCKAVSGFADITVEVVI